MTIVQETQTYQEQKQDGYLGCGNFLSYIYFISFTILVSMLIMNLSVAAVIEGLDTAKRENMGLIRGENIELLIDLWMEYDHEATGWITMTDLVFLLYQLPPPLGSQNLENQFDEEDEKREQKGGSRVR